VPPDSATRLPTDMVGALYRQRMHIELTCRDWKTHWGIRGLRLAVDLAPRLERLLLALTVAYTLAVLLGVRSPVSPQGPCDGSSVPSAPPPLTGSAWPVAPSIRSLRRQSQGSRSTDGPRNGSHSNHLSSRVPPRQPGSSKNWGAARLPSGLLSFGCSKEQVSCTFGSRVVSEDHH
jgi:hypothetical protein